MRKLCYIFILLALGSCGSRDTDFFNGEMIDIKDNAMEKEVEFKSVEFDGITSGCLSVYDSLAICLNIGSSSHWYQVLNLKSGEEIGKFAMRGNGHKDFTPVGRITNYCIEGNELKTLIFEPNREYVHIWNITRSLSDNTTVIDRQIKIPWREQNKGACFQDIFIKDSNTAYCRVDPVPVNDHESTLPYYQIRDLESGEKTGEIQIFKKCVVNKQLDYIPEFFYSNDAMNPDGSKIVQVMMNVPQLNIIDLKTKKTVGYHLDSGMNISDLETAKDMNWYFLNMCADEDYIYSVFWGKGPLEVREIPCINKIYVFDWDGHFVSKITTKHCIDKMAVDPVNKILYTTSTVDDKLYYIDTEELIGNSSK